MLALREHIKRVLCPDGVKYYLEVYEFQHRSVLSADFAAFRLAMPHCSLRVPRFFSFFSRAFHAIPISSPRRRRLFFCMLLPAGFYLLASAARFLQRTVVILQE